ncbi:hypothetical protein P168DRAFT_289321 [Aspergillus campestris IBT 28561]|uniref:Uncharacterized protein n=1 Tax=Aspergillus campestris (strain IBT 28561) TaxID=1392248 RepID=A0A2I1D7Q4_ASPC2|nr:uncharacterized protein P168DRAFT_289321 [Aspergillus campestris IBT 28561]PKY05912.1 hypothetical protein P168DRAFT_289321 [Aspergillus campestris IBT 28561]
MVFTSSRCKRASSEQSDCPSPAGSSPSTPLSATASLPETERLREEGDLGNHSPRAAVASRLGDLAIRGDRLFSTTPHIPHNPLAQEHLAAAVRSAQAGIFWPGSRDMPEPGVPIDNGTSPGGPTTEDQSQSQAQPQIRESLLLPPPPPPPPPPSPPRQNSPSVTSSPKKKPTSSPRKKRNPPSTSQRNRRSPPPPASSAAEDPLTWHDSEITGHDPTDPTDDGYGINGIGFRPTAATAWMRSQKRQKQMTEWKNREAREARERRKDRRNAGGLDLHSIRNGSIQKKVKFDV